MISIVIPVYRNESNIPRLIQELDRISTELDGTLEVVFVVDGSPDQSLVYLRAALPDRPFRSQLVSLSRNFGSFEAIRAGLGVASGEYFAVMAADLQEPIELILDFYDELRGGGCDIAIGKRTSRQEAGVSKWFANLFWWVYRRYIQTDIPKGGVDVFGCNRVVRDCLLQLRENNSSLVGLLFWVGFRRVLVPYQRLARESGVSAWTFAKKLRYLSDSIFSFSDLPIQILLRVGVFGLLLSFVLAVVVVLSKLFGSIAVPGYAPIVLLIMFFGALNCFGLGIIGGYVWRTFENTKQRPNYLIASHDLFQSTSVDKKRNA